MRLSVTRLLNICIHGSAYIVPLSQNDEFRIRETLMPSENLCTTTSVYSSVNNITFHWPCVGGHGCDMTCASFVYKQIRTPPSTATNLLSVTFNETINA